MDEDIGGLKFIASLFRMAIIEIRKIMGTESLQTIFRLMGESVGERVAERIKASNPEEFAEKLKSDVLEPVLGEGGVETSINGNEISVVLKVCPFQKAGIDISDKFYCTYTEGLIETSAKKSLGQARLKSEKLRAIDGCDCQFKIILD
ncbi:MAG: methanogen output domain 1-containing protein [Promethearchaeota archaeon]